MKTNIQQDAIRLCRMTCQEKRTESLVREVQKEKELTNLEKESGKEWSSQMGR